MKDYEKRVLEFCPQKINNNNILNKYKRTQGVSISKIFPQEDKKLCACGCGEKLEGRRTRWYSNECMKFAQAVWGIFTGQGEVISKYLRLKLKNWACCNCGVMDKWKEFKNGMVVNGIHKDHIIAVKNGGGGCWLDNYQLLCDDCHKEKTKKE